jgi:hypothetical protein
MKYKIILLAACTVAIASCGTKAPECGDQQVQDLATQIIKDTSRKQMEALYPYGMPDEIKNKLDNLKLSLAAIRTTATNKETGAQECAAELDNGTGKVAITYKVELTNKKGEFYVTVNGI